MIQFLLIAVLALASIAPAAAATPDAPPRPRRLGMCAACHGTHGIARVPGAPNLAGQKRAYLLSALQQYRDGRRSSAEMRAAVGPLSDADLKQLARWFSSQSAACTDGHTH